MTKRIEYARMNMLVENLRSLADNTDVEEEKIFMEALADDIESREVKEDQILEAIEIITL